MGNPNDDMRMDFGLDVDETSFRKGIKNLDTTETGIKDVGLASKFAQRALKGLGPAMSESSRKALVDVVDLRVEMDRLEASTQKATKSSKGIGKGGSARGLVTSASSFAGGGAGDILGAADALLDLKSSAAEAIGPLTGSVKQLAGLGVAGAATAAAVALAAIALKNYTDEARAQAEELGDIVSARRKVSQEVVGGLTSDEAAARIAELNRLREEEASLLSDLERENEALNEQFGAARGAIELVDERFQKLTQSVDESKGIIGDYDAEIQALQNAMDGGKLAANDATIATEEQAAAADKVAQSAEKAAETQTREAEKARAAQEKAAEDAARKAQETANKIIAANTKYAQAVQDINKDVSRSLRDAVKDSKRAARDLTLEINRSELEANRTANDEALALNKSYYRDAERAQRDSQRAIKDILKQGNRAQQDLLAARDFLALDQLSKQTQRQLEDVGDSAKSAAEERDIAAKEASEDLSERNRIDRRERQIAYRNQRNDLKTSLRDQRIDIRQSARDRLADAATARNREIELAQQGANALIGIESQMWQARIGMSQAGAASLSAAPAGGGYGGNVNFNINGSNMTRGQIDAQIRQAMQGMGVIPN